MDLGGVGYTVRVDGQERQIPANDVAAIDFTGGSISNADWDKLSGGGQLLMLEERRNHNRPTRGHRRIVAASNDIPDVVRRARLLVERHRPDRHVPTGQCRRDERYAPRAAVRPVQGLRFPRQQQWTPTGVTVRRGDWVSFNASGEIHIGSEGNPAIGVERRWPECLRPGAPVANGAAGALVGRVGNSAPFLHRQSKPDADAGGRAAVPGSERRKPPGQHGFVPGPGHAGRRHGAETLVARKY